MTRRSPTSERYQKYTSPSGKTRKSAAAAKPKRAAGAAPTPSKSGTSSAEAKRDRAAAINPPTPEYQRWRKIWWGLLLAALALTGGSWLLRTNTSMVTLASISLALGYGAIFGALYVDWTKLRRLRQEWLNGGRDAYLKEEAAKAKAEKAVARQAATSVEEEGHTPPNES